MMDIASCEEDFFYSQPPPEGTLHPPSESDEWNSQKGVPPRNHCPLTRHYLSHSSEAPLWKLSKNVRELEVQGNGPGLREYDFKDIITGPRDEVEAGPRLERRTKIVIRTINEAENLEKLNLSKLYPGENDQRPEIFLAIFPQVCCIPTIVVFTGRYCPQRWKRWENMTHLYPALLSLSERKGALKAEDIRGLGKDVEETIDHPLSAFAGFLQEEELPEKIVERWNKRYSVEKI